jgi:hypothetical protein
VRTLASLKAAAAAAAAAGISGSLPGDAGIAHDDGMGLPAHDDDMGLPAHDDGMGLPAALSPVKEGLAPTVAAEVPVTHVGHHAPSQAAKQLTRRAAAARSATLDTEVSWRRGVAEKEAVEEDLDSMGCEQGAGVGSVTSGDPVYQQGPGVGAVISGDSAAAEKDETQAENPDALAIVAVQEVRGC